MMHNSASLTIRELPKSKKMSVDEQHPIQKMQKNVNIASNTEIYFGGGRKNGRNQYNLWQCDDDDAAP